jgi:ketosteroid isomerase-like protein
MATVEPVRTLLETFEAYEEKDFARLAELYAEDVRGTARSRDDRTVRTATTSAAS